MFRMASTSPPPFQLGGSKYSQETFSGRLRHFLDVIDPRTLFTPQSELEKCVRILQNYKEGRREGVADEDLWRAQKIKQAIIHPDTGSKIPMVFRMSGLVPFSIPIVTGLLLPGQTLASTVFWQWLNQSHNACINYCNRNASKGSSTKDFIIGYAGAVSLAVSIAVGLNILLKKSHRLSPTKRLLMQRFIPFPAVAFASVSNVLIMRKRELKTGIEVTDKEGKVIGVSKVAARRALRETALTRAVLPVPVLLIPPIVMSYLERTQWYNQYKSIRLPTQVLVCSFVFAVAVPLSISLFPQISQIQINRLEENIRDSTDLNVLYYNKGL